MKKISILALLVILLPAFLLVPLDTKANGFLSLSQTSVSINVGQSTTINAYPSSGQLVNLTGNTNTFVALANVSNNVITVYGVGAGTSQLTFCTYDNACGTVFVNVGGSNTNPGQITLSQTSVFLTVNQSSSVTAYSTNGGSVYISSNSNPSVVSSYVSGNTISLSALAAGSSTISICGNNVSCTSLFVTVTGSIPTNVSFSPSSVTLGYQQNTTVSVYSNGVSGQNYYVSSNSNPNAVSASVSGSTLYLYGQSQGSSTITVCVNNQGSCGSLFVTVTGQTNSQITFSQNPVNLNSQQSSSVIVYGNNSVNTNYFISTNSNPNVASATVSGSNVYIYGQNHGTTNVTVCQTGNTCAVLVVNVNFPNNGGNLILNTASLPQYTVNQFYSSQLVISGGQNPYTFYLNSGSLPPGMSLSSGGQISGTSAASGTYTFSIRVNDNFGRTYTSQNLTLSSGSVLGSQTYANGTLVNDNGTIYIIYKNLKSAFANMTAFSGLGYRTSNVIKGSTSSQLTSGYVVGSANGPHPWGSWIKYGTTVYFVHETGLIPVSSYDIFVNNGGSNAAAVNANSHDLVKTILPVMSYNDSRLK
jgi:hypothetical protein